MNRRDEIIELFNLKNKTAIVTGGGRGLGEQIAFGLAEAGANIVVCSRNLTACQDVSERLKGMGVQSLALQCDIRNGKDIDYVVQETIKRFGTIDILVNNSGTSWAQPILSMPANKWDHVFNVNVKGTFLFSQAAAKFMIQQKSGKIINIASVAGLGGQDPEIMDVIAYSTSKGALVTFTKDLAMKLSPYNIQVNAIAPGLFPTKITEKALDRDKILARTPAGRFGSDSDLKGAAVFLASNSSDYVIGHVLVVDGGISAGIL